MHDKILAEAGTQTGDRWVLPNQTGRSYKLVTAYKAYKICQFVGLEKSADKIQETNIRLMFFRLIKQPQAMVRAESKKPRLASTRDERTLIN